MFLSVGRLELGRKKGGNSLAILPFSNALAISASKAYPKAQDEGPFLPVRHRDLGPNRIEARSHRHRVESSDLRAGDSRFWVECIIRRFPPKLSCIQRWQAELELCWYQGDRLNLEALLISSLPSCSMRWLRLSPHFLLFFVSWLLFFSFISAVRPGVRYAGCPACC